MNFNAESQTLMRVYLAQDIIKYQICKDAQKGGSDSTTRILTLPSIQTHDSRVTFFNFSTFISSLIS